MDIDTIIKNVCVLIPVALSLIQIAPIKINPWSAILQWIGNEINKDVKADLKSIHKEIDDIRAENDKNEARRLRANILDFANSCRNKRKHTKDEFENIARDYEDYMDIIKKRGMKNGFLEEEYSYIKDIFHECQRENSFL